MRDLSVCSVDLPLWVETEGLIEYVRDFLEASGAVPPLVEAPEEQEEQEEAVDEQEGEAQQEVVLTPQQMHAMYVDMFATAMELVEQGEGEHSGEESQEGEEFSGSDQDGSDDSGEEDNSDDE